MAKNNILPKVEEIRNFEEYGSELMKQIIEKKFDWITEDNNYQNKTTGEIINTNNFTPKQNQQIKNCLELLETIKQNGQGWKIV